MLPIHNGGWPNAVYHVGSLPRKASVDEIFMMIRGKAVQEGNAIYRRESLPARAEALKILESLFIEI